MPTASRTPSYRKHKASGQAVVTLSGRDYYLGPYGTAASKREYDRVIGEWLGCGRRDPGTDGEQTTVEEVLAGYLEFATGYYCKGGRPTSELDGVKAAMRPVRRLYALTLANSFNPTALKAARQTFIDAGNCRRVVNQQTHRIKRIFRWAVENDLVSPTVYHGLQCVAALRKGRCEAKDHAPIRPVPDAWVDAVLPQVSEEVAAMIRLQRLTGMRSGEVTIMRACDIDTSGAIWLYTPATHKTEHHDQPRVVELGPKSQAIIKPFLRTDTTAYLFEPAAAERKRNADKRAARQTPRYPSHVRHHQRRRARRRARRFCEHYDSSSYRHAVQRGCLKAGVEVWHPHQLRHNFATMVRKQFGAELARVLCGHSRLQTTEIYAEVDRTKAREVMAKIG